MDSLRRTVGTASRSSDARLRLVAAQWCGTVLGAEDVEAKLMCVELAGDDAREVRVEAYRGLVPGTRFTMGVSPSAPGGGPGRNTGGSGASDAS